MSGAGAKEAEGAGVEGAGPVVVVSGAKAEGAEGAGAEGAEGAGAEEGAGARLVVVAASGVGPVAAWIICSMAGRSRWPSGVSAPMTTPLTRAWRQRRMLAHIASTSAWVYIKLPGRHLMRTCERSRKVLFCRLVGLRKSTPWPIECCRGCRFLRKVESSRRRVSQIGVRPPDSRLEHNSTRWAPSARADWALSMVVQQTSKSVVIGGIIGEFLRAKETKLKKIRVFLQIKN